MITERAPTITFFVFVKSSRTFCWSITYLHTTVISNVTSQHLLSPVWGCGTYSFLQFPASAAGWGALTLGRVTELSFTPGSWQICRDIAISTGTGHKMTVLTTMTPLCTQKRRKLIDCYHLLFMCLFRQRDIFRWGTVDVDVRGQMLDKNQRRKQTKQQRVHQYTT